MGAVCVSVSSLSDPLSLSLSLSLPPSILTSASSACIAGTSAPWAAPTATRAAPVAKRALPPPLPLPRGVKRDAPDQDAKEAAMTGPPPKRWAAQPPGI